MPFEQIKVELQEWMGNDYSIANSAWTSSYDKTKREEKSDEDVERVIKTMAKSGHGTPFESVVLRFWLYIPIFTDRQHMTHRIASHNGLSGRYRTVPIDYFDLPNDVMNILSIATVHQNDLIGIYYNSCEVAKTNYKIGIEALKKSEKEGLITNTQFKRAREIWRGQMPQCAMTERTTIMNLRSFANYQRLRNSEHAQPEIRYVAELMLKEIESKNVCKIALQALKENGWRI